MKVDFDIPFVKNAWVFDLLVSVLTGPPEASRGPVHIDTPIALKKVKQ